MKSRKLKLPEDFDDPHDRCQRFSEGLEETMRATIAEHEPIRPEIQELIDKTNDLIESSYAVGFMDAVAQLVTLMREYADRFEVKISGGIELEGLEDHLSEQLVYPEPEVMDKHFRFLKPFTY